MQFHPEFEPDFARALIEAGRDRLPDPDAAIASLAAPDDRAAGGGVDPPFPRGLTRAEPFRNALSSAWKAAGWSSMMKW